MSKFPTHISPEDLVYVPHIQEFTDLGAIIRGEPPGFFCPLFLTKQPGRYTEEPLIFNLKPLNKFLKVRKFRMDSINSVFHIIGPNDFQRPGTQFEDQHEEVRARSNTQ